VGAKQTPKVTEKPVQKGQYLTDSQFLIQELLRMQETVTIEKTKRKKLNKRFNELDELFNIMEDNEVAKPQSIPEETVPEETVPETVPETVEESIQEEFPKMNTTQRPARRITLRDIAMNKN
jgi:hypothetical protein